VGLGRRSGTGIVLTDFGTFAAQNASTVVNLVSLREDCCK